MIYACSASTTSASSIGSCVNPYRSAICRSLGSISRWPCSRRRLQCFVLVFSFEALEFLLDSRLKFSLYAGLQPFKLLGFGCSQLCFCKHRFLPIVLCSLSGHQTNHDTQDHLLIILSTLPFISKHYLPKKSVVFPAVL
jgi:hypothetical protein